VGAVLFRLLGIAPSETDTVTWSMILSTALGSVPSGVIAGATFATTVAFVGRRVLDWRISTAARWGAAAAIAVPVVALAMTGFQLAVRLPGYVGYMLLTSAILGAGCAAGSIALARRAPRAAILAPPNGV
jgi:hypothetical protein